MPSVLGSQTCLSTRVVAFLTDEGTRLNVIYLTKSKSKFNSWPYVSARADAKGLQRVSLMYKVERMAQTESKLWYLENINIFRDLTQDEIEDIDRKSTMKSFSRKVHIYFPDDPAQVVYLLKKGRVKIVSYGQNEQEMINRIIYPGEIFGELAITSPQDTRKDYAIALDKDVKLCTISRDEMIETLEKNPRLRGTVTQLLGNRMQEMQRRFERMVFYSAEERLVLFLKDLAAKVGQPVGDEILIKHGLTHEEIGQLTGISRQLVTTMLNDLKREDKIYMERNKILIRDINSL